MDLHKNADLREKIMNYEQFKIKELYMQIINDDGKAPETFEKDHLVVGRELINEICRRDLRLSSRNVRSIQASYISL